MLVLDATLWVPSSQRFCQRGDSVDDRKELAGIFPSQTGGPLAAWLVGVPERRQTAVAGPAVGDHMRARLDARGHERAQTLRGSIGEDLHASSSDTRRFEDLHSHAYKGLLALRASAAKVQSLRCRCRSRRPPRRLAGGLGPGRSAPRAAGAASPTRSHRSRSPSCAAGSTRRCRPCPTRQPDRLEPHMPALRADEAARPTQPVQVVQAVRIGAEPGPQLAGRTRVVHPSARTKLLTHRTST